MGSEFCNGCEENFNLIDFEDDLRSHNRKIPVPIIKNQCNSLYTDVISTSNGNINYPYNNYYRELNNSNISNSNYNKVHKKSHSQINLMRRNIGSKKILDLIDTRKFNLSALKLNTNTSKNDDYLNNNYTNTTNNDPNNNYITNSTIFGQRKEAYKENNNEEVVNLLTGNIYHKKEFENNNFSITENSEIQINNKNRNEKKLNSYNNFYNNISSTQSFVDFKKLENIVYNYKLKLIINSFRQLKKLKEKSHKKIYIEVVDLNENTEEEIEELELNLMPDKKYIYIGNKFMDHFDGLGLQNFDASGARFFGRFINGNRNGLGKYLIYSESKYYSYKGEVYHNYAQGYGIYENYKNGIIFEGEWKDSKKEGFGIEIYSDKSYYRGNFLNGKKNGIGEYIWNDNSYYKGEWSNNMLQGYGEYLFKDGSIYFGKWSNNKMHGIGEFTCKNEKTYIGNFDNDFKSGFGISFWFQEEKVFLGFWSKNKQNGYGKFISGNKIRYGLWKNGKIIDKIENYDKFIESLSEKELGYRDFFECNSYNAAYNIIQKLSLA